MRIQLSLLILAISLSGCGAGGAYVKPTVDVPTAYKEGRDSSAPTQPQPGWAAAMPSDAQDRGAWWEVFGNQQLNDLESRVSISNQTIQKAVATLQQARAAVGVARSNYFPTVTAGVSQDRLHTSQNVIGRQQLAGRTVSDYSVGMAASWEPDLFDRIGHAVDAATARAQASAADLASVQLSMHAELAVDYFDLHDSDAQIMLLQKTVKAYQDALDLVRHRFDAGSASDFDVAQAQTQLETTQSQLLDLNVANAQLQHAIATLIGEPASNFSLSTDGSQLAPPAVPTGIPSELLERRPDVAAAERRVAASTADIGQATAAFFPDLILSASGGLESSNLAGWLAMPSRFWAIGPALIGTLFDGGRRKHQLESAKAASAASLADYRQIALSAFQEVEDNLAAGQTLAAEAQRQDQAVRSSRHALEVALNRYQAGAVSYLEVTVAQSTALANERAATEIARRRSDASVSLIKALGGLWTAPSLLGKNVDQQTR
ncbi:MAG TPA: efflux transporter outer membrane subunit [Steroidobacteraceae bacterium]|jgi:NodT family efflux transporter outer membrane factor (OMF) lipoprotein|nr:efflux transporter outer membrane subunit [Steroidobacteraceae bacterium]